MEQDEKHIIGNLFEHWACVGERAGLLTTAPSYKAVMPEGSDWPRRVFDVADREALKDIADQIKKEQLPDAVTFTASVAEDYAPQLAAAGFQPKMTLQGMIIYLRENPPGNYPGNISFRIADKEADAMAFANIAAGSFNYRVSGAVVTTLLGAENKIKVFTGTVDGVAACSGLVYYDDNGNAGLHFIGTLPEFRGKGLAAAMTTRLLQECAQDGKRYCVLHASKAGLPIYTRLGFEPVKEVITYAIN